MKIGYIILYVADQNESTQFYKTLLQKEPCLVVPGMTEFLLSDSLKLGLMPNDGIAKILKSVTPHPSLGKGIPRCELYFYTDSLEVSFLLAIENGATLVSPIASRDWGDTVGYLADKDGHIIALAQKGNNKV